MVAPQTRALQEAEAEADPGTIREDLNAQDRADHMKRLTLLLAMAALPSLAPAANALPAMQGTAPTCQVSIDGAPTGVVRLATVEAADFAGAGSVAGLTPFTVTISDCPAPQHGNLNVVAIFRDYNITAAGNLGNLAAHDAALDVAVQLTTHTEHGVRPIDLAVTHQIVDLLVLRQGQTSASHQLGARYITEGGNPTPGAVTAVAEFAIDYL